MRRNIQKPLILTGILLAGSLFVSQARADNGANHQVRNVHFGVSGGSASDRSKAYCCGGTLGALVQDTANNQYILSNNHVLARTDQAAPGEDITQPGLIDNRCRPATRVADFTVAPPLGSNVDAAIAQLVAGMMDPTGYIEDIGVPSSIVRDPAPGLPVAKSGRTTGFTTGNIGAINATVSVRYQKGCGSGKKFVISYTDQVVIDSSTFSAGGDSGSLIVTNDSCHQPVALLFAGSSTTTIGNRAGEVLTQASAALGSELNFVGTTCGSAAPAAGPSQAVIDQASAAARERAPELMGRGPVIGVGVGISDENPLEAVMVIYIDRTAGVVPQLPEQVRGVRVKRVFTDPFIAYGCCARCR